MAHVQDQKATVSEQMMQAGKSTCFCSVCHTPAGLLTDSQLLTCCCTSRMQHLAFQLTGCKCHCSSQLMLHY